MNKKSLLVLAALFSVTALRGMDSEQLPDMIADMPRTKFGEKISTAILRCFETEYDKNARHEKYVEKNILASAFIAWKTVKQKECISVLGRLSLTCTRDECNLAASSASYKEAPLVDFIAAMRETLKNHPWFNKHEFKANSLQRSLDHLVYVAATKKELANDTSFIEKQLKEHKDKLSAEEAKIVETALATAQKVLKEITTVKQAFKEYSSDRCENLRNAHLKLLNAWLLGQTLRA